MITPAEHRRRKALAEKIVLAVANAAGVMPHTLRVQSNRPYIVELKRIVVLLGIEKKLTNYVIGDALDVHVTTVSRLGKHQTRHFTEDVFNHLLNQARRAL